MRKKSTPRIDSSGTVAVYDSIANAYSKSFAAPTEHLDVFARAVASTTPHGRVLDIGCGPGKDTAYLARKGFRATGIDASTGMIAAARRRYTKQQFRRADMRKLRLTPNSVDGIVLSFCLIHLTKREVSPLLDKVSNALRPGGHVFIAIQAGRSAQRMVRELLPPGGKVFLNIMSRRELDSLLRAAGLDIVERFSRPPRGEIGEFPFTKYVVIARRPLA
jgi:trans-aconitate methyltransferase